MATLMGEYREVIGRLPEGATLIIQQVGWDEYERLLDELVDRPDLRLNYDRGRLEVTTPLAEHEAHARFVDDLRSPRAHETARPQPCMHSGGGFGPRDRSAPFIMSALTRATIGASVVLGLAAAGSAQQASYESLNVCEKVPAAELATALAGRVLDAKPVNVKGFVAARCVYGIEITGTRRAFVLWVNPAADFDGLRKASEPPVTVVKDVGDEAFATTDNDTKRVQLTARARGKVTVQVTSERLEWAQTVAKIALSKF